MTEQALPASEESVASPAAVILPLLIVGLIGAFLLSVALGPIPITVAEIFAALTGGPVDATLRDVVLELRIPRSLMALGVGAVLAVGGTAMQGLFRNPLADPTLIGVSGGAALAAASFIVFGASFRNITTRWLGSRSASFGNGLRATTSFHSSALRTRKSASRPRRFAASVSSRCSSSAPVRSSPRKTRFPLCSSVRASAKPSSLKKSRKSDIATARWPPTLTPRSSAMWTDARVILPLQR